MTNSKITVAEYLARRLEQMGVRRFFGVPGNPLDTAWRRLFAVKSNSFCPVFRLAVEMADSENLYFVVDHAINNTERESV